MGIDLSSLPPWAQKQVADKLMSGNDAKRTEKKPQKGEAKYRNKPDYRTMESGASLRFASKKEARRYDELMLMLKAGEIDDLKLQHDMTLQEAYTTPDGKRVRAIRYKADFTYWRSGKFIVEDAKGYRTDMYKLKRNLFREKYGFDITEV